MARPPSAQATIDGYWRRSAAIGALAAAIVAWPDAMAQTPREAELEVRLNQLEAAVTALKTELTRARTDQQASAHMAQKADDRVAALEDEPATDGFQVGGTTFRIGGFVKMVGSATRYDDGAVPGGALGKEFYLPQQIPVGGRSSRDMIGHARQSRLFFETETMVGAKALKSHIEFDFGLATAPVGAQRATNPYTPTLRRAFFTYGDWLVGQEWTAFQNPALLPETTDYVGPMEGTVFVRQMVAQYRRSLGDGLSLTLSAENPQTETVTPAAADLVDHDNDRMPDLVAKLAYKGVGAEWHVAGLMRTLSVDDAGAGGRAMGWGVSGGARIDFGPRGRHDLRVLATYGRGIGRYLGLGAVADAVHDPGQAGRLGLAKNLSGYAAVKLGWSDGLRSTFMAGYHRAIYPSDFAVPGLADRTAYSLAGNLFWSPVKHLDLGIEYRHAQRDVVSGLSGQMDRLEMAAKYTF
ncbi:MAG: hypothetical protein C0494_09230 [Sphingobium sp.]|nr:hypothetical protein [Sphingobium sp.]